MNTLLANAEVVSDNFELKTYLRNALRKNPTVHIITDRDLSWNLHEVVDSQVMEFMAENSLSCRYEIHGTTCPYDRISSKSREYFSYYFKAATLHCYWITSFLSGEEKGTKMVNSLLEKPIAHRIGSTAFICSTYAND